MLKAAEPKWKNVLKLYKYLKPKFAHWLLIFNTVFLLYSCLPLTFLQLLPILIITATLLKSLKIPWIYSLMLADA